MMEPIEYLVYFGDKPYYITNHLSPTLQKLAHTAGTIMVNQPDVATVKKSIRDIDTPGAHAVILLTNEVAFFWEVFQQNFTAIGAGGGVVTNPAGDLLMILRRGMWDLPKGKWDDGETIEACALREVQEETGLQTVVLGPLVTQTYHTYVYHGEAVLKTTWWYRMEAPGAQSLVPQAEEDITAIEWVPQAEVAEKARQTFASIRQVLALLRA